VEHYTGKNVKEFPFEYAIINLDQLEEYKKKGYKYILEYLSLNIQREKGLVQSFRFWSTFRTLEHSIDLEI
jgi:hypothetical protein